MDSLLNELGYERAYAANVAAKIFTTWDKYALSHHLHARFKSESELNTIRRTYEYWRPLMAPKV